MLQRLRMHAAARAKLGLGKVRTWLGRLKELFRVLHFSEEIVFKAALVVIVAEAIMVAEWSRKQNRAIEMLSKILL